MKNVSNKVIILGAGIAGLTVAHELADRGFSVEILEQRESAGGKARVHPAGEELGELCSSAGRAPAALRFPSR